jgi:predicted alpha/beta-fold hydrolase
MYGIYVRVYVRTDARNPLCRLDGGEVTLRWSKANSNPSTPLLLVLHGVNGHRCPLQSACCTGMTNFRQR